jgi:hypothetical protein
MTSGRRIGYVVQTAVRSARSFEFLSMSPPAASKHRSLVNAFVVFTLIAILFYSQPYAYQPRTLINDVTGGYMRLLGVWAHWDMFAPHPRSIRVRMDATVTLRDGTKRTWTFPQMEQMSLPERTRKERYRKWANDNIRLDAQAAVWEPTARYIARQFTDPRNPPVAVQLHRHWANIPPPSEAGDAVAPQPFQSYTFYETKWVPKGTDKPLAKKPVAKK